jgi:potassium-transporting ATPase potassium-binding subunit
MTNMGILQIVLYIVVLILLVKPLGAFMANVYEDKRTFLDPVLRPVERLIYRLCGVSPDQEMDWKTYAVAMMVFNIVGLVAVYLIQRVQGFLPLNPAGQERKSVV